VFLLQSSAAPDETPIVSAPEGGSAAQAALVSLQEPGTGRPSPLGAFASRDPFAPPGGSPSKKKSGAATSTSAAAAASADPSLSGPSGSLGGASALGGTSTGAAGGASAEGGTSTGAAGGLGGSSAGGSSPSASGAPFGDGSSGTPSAPTPGTVKRTHEVFTYVADVKIGRTDKEKTINDIESPRLLPSDTQPFIVFLGATSDKKSALFMIDTSKLTSIGGEGECKPDPVTCSFLTLTTDGKNDLHLFEDNDGGRYSLRLLRLQKKVLDRSSTSSIAPAPTSGSRARGSKPAEPFAFPNFGRLFSR